jgi:hypothetical protein
MAARGVKARRDEPSTRPLLDKLGVKPGLKVSVIGLDDQPFLQQLQDRSVDVSARVRKGSDLILFYLDDQADLPRLEELRHSIQPAGAIWVLWRKGRKELGEEHIRAFGPAVGLVDVKVVAFSATLSALKMVIPVAQRPRV